MEKKAKKPAVKSPGKISSKIRWDEVKKQIKGSNKKSLNIKSSSENITSMTKGGKRAGSKTYTKTIKKR